MNYRPINSGFVYEAPVIDKDWVAGTDRSIETCLGAQALQADGQWDAFLPPREQQFNASFDTMSCVSFANLNVVEMLIRRLFGEQKEYADRFLSRASGTTQNGNSPTRVAETLRLNGVVDEPVWPWNNITSWADFAADIPKSIYDQAKKWGYDFNHEFVPSNPTSMKAALPFGPLSVSVVGWVRDADGYFYKPEGQRDGHMTVIYGYVDGKFWKCLDTYNIAGEGDSVLKKIRWDTNFEMVKRFSIRKQEEVDAELTVFQTLLKYGLSAFWSRFVELFQRNEPAVVTIDRTETPIEPLAPKKTIASLCIGIKVHEGWFPGSRSYRNNNPGNTRYSSVGYASHYKPVLRDKDNFAIFKDYATGWLYLNNLIKEKIYKHPNWTILDLIKEYAPATDHNNPEQYALTLRKRLGVDGNFKISELV